MGATTIEWCDVSWPVLNGCRRVSPGCENCYAERLTATRLRNTPKYRGLAIYKPTGPRWTGHTRLWARELEMPLRLRKPSRIFVADMGDLFFDGNAAEDIAAVFGVMAAAPRHTFMVLTKRPGRMLEWFRWARGSFTEQQRDIVSAPNTTRAMLDAAAEWLGTKHHALNEAWRTTENDPWPLANVWLGVSVENQETADERIPVLLHVSGARHFLSVEPMLERVDLEPWIGGRGHMSHVDGRRITWAIFGGESGTGARECDVNWIRDGVRQCRDARVAPFVKQLGSRPIFSLGGVTRTAKLSKKGGDMNAWPEDLRVREFPTL